MADLGKLGVLEEFYARKIWLLDLGQDVRLVGLSIKVSPGGHLAILKGVSAEGPKVAFYQIKGLDALRRDLVHNKVGDSLKWREDKFAFDKK